ncbi:hypothetical protein [Lentzea cavernae]|uniref:Uncharacterized protein n=1 Tax=Lentzea cavernae TaxID=2020703 RepID=A0ABQ3M7R2_9PSEU|nr:hypothetical protein [Lentzea cavernae]GHH34550.1 hypothetical protein GCM10017774_18720 [Lentzea cavernae]
MPRDAELDRLKAALDQAGEHRESARQDQDAAWQRREQAKEAMNRMHSLRETANKAQQEAWDRQAALREAMNRAYEAMQVARDVQQAAWESYQGVRSGHSSRIDHLKSREDAAHQNMLAAFDRATDAHNARDGASARRWADEGHGYKAEREACKAERRGLLDVSSDAKAGWERTRPAYQHAKDEFQRARNLFDNAKAERERAQTQQRNAKDAFDRAREAFLAARNEHDRLSVGYKAAKRSFIVAHDRYKDRKTELRAIKEDALSIAAIPVQYRDTAVVRHNPDGSVDVFFGGLVEGDGHFHGHYHFEASGEITYRRDPFQDHGPQNFRGEKYMPDQDTSERRQTERYKEYKRRFDVDW